jgi:hypothetical protein
MKFKGDEMTTNDPKAPLNTNDEEASNSKNSSVKDEKNNTHFLLGQKLGFANVAVNVCMVWWVSSVVFCCSILAAVWIQRNDLVKSWIIHLLGVVLVIFFGGVTAFGTLIERLYLCKLHKGISDLTERLNQDDKDIFSTEIVTFRVVMFIGTSSFFLILIVWCFLWVGLARGWWN